MSSAVGRSSCKIQFDLVEERLRGRRCKAEAVTRLRIWWGQLWQVPACSSEQRGRENSSRNTAVRVLIPKVRWRTPGRRLVCNERITKKLTSDCGNQETYVTQRWTAQLSVEWEISQWRGANLNPITMDSCVFGKVFTLDENETNLFRITQFDRTNNKSIGMAINVWVQKKRKTNGSLPTGTNGSLLTGTNGSLPTGLAFVTSWMENRAAVPWSRQLG